MTATAARAAFVAQEFRVVKNGPDGTVVGKYGSAARRSTEPRPSFFVTEADAQIMNAEAFTLLSGDRRRFNPAVLGEGTGLAMVYTSKTPALTMIDDERQVNRPGLASAIDIDFGKQTTTIENWG